MNARQAVNENELMINQLIEGSERVAKLRGISLSEAIDYRIGVCIEYATAESAKAAWELRGEEAKKRIG